MSDSKPSKPMTHFGYRQVPEDEKVNLVRQVFHSVADKYDVMNDLMSLGSHRLLKQFTINMSALRSGHRVLDLAAGTGDLAAGMAPLVGEDGEVVLCDINLAMLQVGRDKLLDHGRVRNLHYVQADAEDLPFPTDYFDCVTIGFGLRNVTRKERALEAMARVLKPGGRLIVLEFSRPKHAVLQKAYDIYSKLWPSVGRVVTGDSDSYQYLVESIRMHPDQETLRGMMETAGFAHCEYHDMLGGIAAIHKGIKP